MEATSHFGISVGRTCECLNEAINVPTPIGIDNASNNMTIRDGALLTFHLSAFISRQAMWDRRSCQADLLENSHITLAALNEN
jgi:hypothetical protein